MPLSGIELNDWKTISDDGVYLGLDEITDYGQCRMLASLDGAADAVNGQAHFREDVVEVSVPFAVLVEYDAEVASFLLDWKLLIAELELRISG